MPRNILRAILSGYVKFLDGNIFLIFSARNEFVEKTIRFISIGLLYCQIHEQLNLIIFIISDKKG